jgi:hypothetical protein
MGDNISIPISEESITVTISDGATWDGVAGKPSAAIENSLMVSNAASGWSSKTLAEVKTILGLNLAVQTVPFAIPLAIDVTTYKDWKCTNVSGDTTLNITGEVDGEAGMVEFYNSASGTVTPGSMFTRNYGGGTYDSTASAYNMIAWTKSGSDILYNISQV